MSAAELEGNWNFRLIEKRLVTIKTKSEPTRKIAALDVLTDLMFVIHVSEAIELHKLEANKEYLFNLKVYTSKNIEGVKDDFINFFDALDIDQSLESFIRAYWAYPTKVRFELDSAEEP